MNLGDRMTSVARPVIRIGGYIAALALAAMMLLTVTDVFLRFVFNRPILGCTEIAEHMMVVLSFLAIAYAAIEGIHVRVELLVKRLRKKAQALFAIIGFLLSLVLCIPLTLVYIPEAISVKNFGEESEVLAIPAFPFYVVVIIGCALLTVVVIIELIKAIQRFTGK